MSDRKQFYVTTPIYYVNERPHLGHAYTTVAADAFARYWRGVLGEENVHFLTGTDEHGAKVAAAAEKAGKAPQQFTDEVSAQYVETWQLLNISYDTFFRTTDPRHRKVVQDLLEKVYDRGLIYKGTYKGTYCIGCEKYLSPDEIVDGHCVLHPTTQLVEQEEENYFFKLSELAPKVLAALEEGQFLVMPEGRRAEIVGKIQAGIEDISISRQGATWGIPVPWDDGHTIYVWVDALINYYSATQFDESLNRFWPASLHLMAKDILWFHALIWEALLMAAELPLPEAVLAHGFFTVDGQKMSKSIGNVIDPVQMVEEYGADAFRYLLLTAFAFGNDGDLSLARFKEKYNADLANGIGNLISRVANLAEKAGYEAPEGKASRIFSPDVAAAMEACKPDEALRAIWVLVADLDKAIHAEEPWKLQGEELRSALARYIEQLGTFAQDVGPFMPALSQAIQAIFFGGPIRKPEPLFLRK
jgi:methionyl-tRNA synthetase